MLKLVAHSGDACHLISDPATLEHKFAVPKQHYKAVGRDDLRGAQRGNRKADMVRIMSIMRWRENNDAENTARAEHEASGQNNDARSLQSHRCRLVGVLSTRYRCSAVLLSRRDSGASRVSARDSWQSSDPRQAHVASSYCRAETVCGGLRHLQLSTHCATNWKGP